MTRSLPWGPARRLVGYYQDKAYFQQLARLALPIALQSFFMSSLNMVGTLMVGQLGETSVAAVGLANQIFFLLQLLLFGINSGAAIFTAQLWGKRDVPNIRRVLGLALLLGLSGSLGFLALTQWNAEALLGIYSKDPAVVALGSAYLRTFSWAYPFIAITFCYAAVLRSIGRVRIPLAVTIGALSFNTLLSYALIFGKFGFPELGVQGAAIAGLIARLVECSALLLVTYTQKTEAAASLRQMFHLDLPFTKKVLKPMLPVVANEILWSLGIAAYNVVYARMGTEPLAAMNIVSSIENMAFVIFIGIGNACAILVGNRIGAGEEEEAYVYAGRSLGLGVMGGLGMGLVVFLIAEPLLSLYKVSPEVIAYAYGVMVVITCTLWVRASNLILFIGIFRAGGDTRFAFLLDAVIIWVVGVPLAFLGGLVLQLPVYWVYLLVLAEEFTKLAIGSQRYFSRRWIHNLARTVSP